ncbi:MAG TPA: hypothetical protein PLH43_02430 [Acetivibrio sp.]|uniref:hypothetical protein n=1 Tax=Acetivibrio sp. TaxID=1872092 RepID=UPI002CB4F9B4|nr:hypothetical protein [Acetivibrio sp.]HOM01669.1 hypothetical protein [Acetivibrio sp.]
MKYLQKVFKFLEEHFLLVLPLIIAAAIPQIIIGTVDDTQMTEAFGELVTSVESGAIDAFEALRMALEVMKPLFLAICIANVISFLLSLFIVPATYGMINKGLETNKVDIGDFVSQMGMNLPKYIVYTIFSFFVDIVLLLILGLVIALFAFIIYSLLGVGTAAVILGIVIALAVGVVIYVVMYGIKCVLSYWFPAMLVDNMNVTSAFKKAIEVGRSYLWQTIGISFLISMANSTIVGALSGFADALPHVVRSYVVPVLISVPSGLASFIMMAFYLAVYRDKTRVKEENDNENVIDSGGEFV